MKKCGLKVIDLGLDTAVIVIDYLKFHPVHSWRDSLRCLSEQGFLSHTLLKMKELEFANSDLYHRFQQCFEM